MFYGVVEPRADGANRNVQHGSDLLVGKFRLEAQFDNFTKCGVKFCDGLAHGFEAGINRCRDFARQFLRQFLNRAKPPKSIGAEVAGDAKEIGLRRYGEAKAVRPPEDCGKRLLQQVLGGVPVGMPLLEKQQQAGPHLPVKLIEIVRVPVNVIGLVQWFSL